MPAAPSNSATMDRMLGLLKGTLNAMNLFAEGDEISMRPRAIMRRCVRVANVSTLAVMLIVYPILIAYRGLDYPLMAGMLLHYLLLWFVVIFLFLFLHASWIVAYFVSQRFCTNLLDFEIIDQILGRDNYSGDMSDFDDLDFLGHNVDVPSLDGNQKRATG